MQYTDRTPRPLPAHYQLSDHRADKAPLLSAWQKEGLLEIPVLAIGAELSVGASVEHVMREVATDVTGLVIPGSGHFVTEEAPDAMTKALLDFFR